MGKYACVAVLVLGMVTVGAVGAKADSVTITGSGVWGSGAPTSSWSAPGDTWSFSLSLPNPVSASSYHGTVEILVTDISSFSYALNGVSVNIAPSGLIFFPSSENGGFDADFTAGGMDTTNGITCSVSTVCSLNFFGAQLYSGSAPQITIHSGSAGTVDFDYTASALLDSTNANGTGTVNNFTVATPEPATVSLLALGALGLFVRRRKK